MPLLTFRLQIPKQGSKTDLVKLHKFIGLTIEEAAKVLGISDPTAKPDRTHFRAWLYREIAEARPHP